MTLCPLMGGAMPLVYEALINLRPRVGDRSMDIQDPAIRAQINRIVQSLLGNVAWQ